MISVNVTVNNHGASSSSSSEERRIMLSPNEVKKLAAALPADFAPMTWKRASRTLPVWETHASLPADAAKAFKDAAKAYLFVAALGRTDRNGLKGSLGAFAYPVDLANNPHYTKFIARPICLDDICRALLAGTYDNLQTVLDDVRLVFTNAKVYNPPDHVYHKAATRMEHEYHVQLQAHGLWPRLSPAPAAPEGGMIKPKLFKAARGASLPTKLPTAPRKMTKPKRRAAAAGAGSSSSSSSSSAQQHALAPAPTPMVLAHQPVPMVLDDDPLARLAHAAAAAQDANTNNGGNGSSSSSALAASAPAAAGADDDSSSNSGSAAASSSAASSYTGLKRKMEDLEARCALLERTLRQFQQGQQGGSASAGSSSSSASATADTDPLAEPAAKKPRTE